MMKETEVEIRNKRIMKSLKEDRDQIAEGLKRDLRLFISTGGLAIGALDLWLVLIFWTYYERVVTALYHSL